MRGALPPEAPERSHGQPGEVVGHLIHRLLALRHLRHRDWRGVRAAAACAARRAPRGHRRDYGVVGIFWKVRDARDDGTGVHVRSGLQHHLPEARQEEQKIPRFARLHWHAACCAVCFGEPMPVHSVIASWPVTPVQAAAAQVRRCAGASAAVCGSKHARLTGAIRMHGHTADAWCLQRMRSHTADDRRTDDTVAKSTREGTGGEEGRGGRVRWEAHGERGVEEQARGGP